MSRFKGRFRGKWSIHNARMLPPDDFQLARETIGLRLCGVSHVPHLADIAHVSEWKVRRILSGYGQTLREGHERGLWFPFGGGCGEYIFNLFDYPEWLPRRGLMTHGWKNDLRVIDPDTLNANISAFKKDHMRYCLAHERQRDARRVSGGDLAVSGKA